MSRESKKVSAKKEFINPGKRALGSEAFASPTISPSSVPASVQTLPVEQKNLSWQEKRDHIRRRVAENPIKEISEEELEAHFEGMPARYWDKIDESELVWGLRNIHRFLNGVVASPMADTPVAVSWRYFPEEGYTRVLICTWDRLGLLAKVAGYASALHLNVIRAEVYTRPDNLVLDSFWICNAEQQSVSDPERLRQFVFLLEGGLSESPSFAATWALETHKFLPRTPRMTPAVMFNNVDSPEQTILTVEASERPGLLYDMLQVLSDHRVSISQALIDTVSDTAQNIFFVTDEHKRKLLAADQLTNIERALVEAVM